MTTRSEIMRRTSKFYICDGCGQEHWEDDALIYEIIVHIIGVTPRKIMHFCSLCVPKAIIEYMENAEEL